MIRFAANTTLLFTEVDFPLRFAAAARAGFAAVEFQFPYAYDKELLRKELLASGLTLVLHNLPAGDWAAGERGIACHPDRVAEFEAGVVQALDYAKALGSPQLNCLAGRLPADVEPQRAEDTFVRNLQFAAPRLADEGIRLLIEPVNTYDVERFLVSSSGQALDIIDRTGSSNLFLQYDVYHMHRMGEQAAAVIDGALPRIGHIQIADHPGRHEPGTGEIDFSSLFRLLGARGYPGWIGCEYVPAGPTELGLNWRRELAPQSTAAESPLI
jgi:hydroxypyruvate isomerase